MVTVLTGTGHTEHDLRRCDALVDLSQLSYAGLTMPCTDTYTLISSSPRTLAE